MGEREAIPLHVGARYMTLLARLIEHKECLLCQEASLALQEQAEDKVYLRAQLEQARYKLHVLQEYVDELETKLTRQGKRF